MPRPLGRPGSPVGCTLSASGPPTWGRWPWPSIASPRLRLADFFRINGWDTEVALGVESYDYFVPLDGEGVYQWIVVAWRQEDQFWDLTSLLGCYYLPDADLPSPVEVGSGEVVSDIDIEVNFAVLDHETELSTALCERALPAELLAELGR